MAEQCHGTVYRDGWPDSCFNPGVVKRDSNWWCRIHDPIKVAERRAKTDARIDAEMHRNKLAGAVTAAERAVVAEVVTAAQRNAGHPLFGRLCAMVAKLTNARKALDEETSDD